MLSDFLKSGLPVPGTCCLVLEYVFRSMERTSCLVPCTCPWNFASIVYFPETCCLVPWNLVPWTGHPACNFLLLSSFPWNILSVPYIWFSLDPGTCSLVPCISPPVPGISCHCLFFLEHAAWFLKSILWTLEHWCLFRVPLTLHLGKCGRRNDWSIFRYGFDSRLYRTIQSVDFKTQLCFDCIGPF